MSRQIHVTHTMRPAQLAAKTVALLDAGEDVVWLTQSGGRRGAVRTLRAAAQNLAVSRPDAVKRFESHEGTSAVVCWSPSGGKWEGASYFITSRPERYTLREVDGEVVALPAEDPAA